MKPTEKPRPYHHGNLVEALIAAAIDIIEDSGVERLSVREVAKRAGVSPGAPFRHFSSKAALLTAVAEQAMEKLVAAVDAAQARVGADDPLGGIEAIGRGYLDWAISNPTHFQIISSRTLIDFDASSRLRESNEAIRQRMIALLEQASSEGRIADGLDFDRLVLASRALVYGLARMAIDGHFPEWHPHEDPREAAAGALRLFIARMGASNTGS